MHQYSIRVLALKKFLNFYSSHTYVHKVKLHRLCSKCLLPSVLVKLVLQSRLGAEFNGASQTDVEKGSVNCCFSSLCNNTNFQGCRIMFVENPTCKGNSLIFQNKKARNKNWSESRWFCVKIGQGWLALDNNMVEEFQVFCSMSSIPEAFYYENHKQANLKLYRFRIKFLEAGLVMFCFMINSRDPNTNCHLKYKSLFSMILNPDLGLMHSRYPPFYPTTIMPSFAQLVTTCIRI